MRIGAQSTLNETEYSVICSRGKLTEDKAWQVRRLRRTYCFLKVRLGKSAFAEWGYFDSFLSSEIILSIRFR